MLDPHQPLLGIADHRRKELGEFLKNRRVSKGRSQSEVAERVGCDPKTISNVETAKCAVSAEILDAIFEVLGVGNDESRMFTPSEIDIGSKEFHVRTSILRGLLQGRLKARDQDIRAALVQFDDDVYRNTLITTEQLNRILATLEQEGFLHQTEDERLVYRPQIASFAGNSYLLYANHIDELLLRQKCHHHYTRQGIARKAMKIVSAADATATSEYFSRTLEAAQLALVWQDPFMAQVTLGYHRGIVQTHSWVQAVVDESERQAFHEGFANRVTLFIYAIASAYASLDPKTSTDEDYAGLDTSSKQLQQDFASGLWLWTLKCLPDSFGIDYTSPDWMGSVKESLREELQGNQKVDET